jgi:hypothetical protein
MMTGERPKGVLDPDEDSTKGPFYDVVQKLLHPKPDKRFQSAAELRIALTAIPTCEPTAHRLVGKVVLPPLSRRAECLRGPPAVAGSGVGYSFSSL